jgi:hypothetical protein
MPSDSENQTLGDTVSELQHIKRKLDTIITNQELALSAQNATNAKLDRIIELLTPSPDTDVKSFGGSISTPTKQNP